MRAGVAVDLQPLLILERDDLDGVPLPEDVREIDKFAVDLRRDCGAGKPFGDRLRRVLRGRALRELHLISVLQNDLHKFPPVAATPANTQKTRP